MRLPGRGALNSCSCVPNFTVLAHSLLLSFASFGNPAYKVTEKRGTFFCLVCLVEHEHLGLHLQKKAQ